MRFLLDENFSRSVAAILLERGRGTVDLRSVGLLGASDAGVAEKAIEAGAVILTTDRDFLSTRSQTFTRNTRAWWLLHCGSRVGLELPRGWSGFWTTSARSIGKIGYSNSDTQLG